MYSSFWTDHIIFSIIFWRMYSEEDTRKYIFHVVRGRGQRDLWVCQDQPAGGEQAVGQENMSTNRGGSPRRYALSYQAWWRHTFNQFLQGGGGGLTPGLGWYGFRLLYSLPGSAWADGIMAELARQLGKMTELLIPSQPNPLSDHQPHPVVDFWWMSVLAFCLFRPSRGAIEW